MKDKERLVFLRKYRWTFCSSGLPEWLVKKIDFDYHNQIINLEIYQLSCNQKLFTWIAKIKNNPNKKGKFVAYDGCGQALQKEFFSNLSIVSETSEYDYASSDAVTLKISLKYKTIKRLFPKIKENCTQSNTDQTQINCLHGKITI